MNEPVALRANEEVSDHVCEELLKLPDAVSKDVAAGVALAMISGAARAYRKMMSAENAEAEIVIWAAASARAVLPPH